jgi:hypothetical protein
MFACWEKVASEKLLFRDKTFRWQENFTKYKGEAIRIGILTKNQPEGGLQLSLRNKINVKSIFFFLNSPLESSFFSYNWVNDTERHIQHWDNLHSPSSLTTSTNMLGRTTAYIDLVYNHAGVAQIPT